VGRGRRDALIIGSTHLTAADISPHLSRTFTPYCRHLPLRQILTFLDEKRFDKFYKHFLKRKNVYVWFKIFTR